MATYCQPLLVSAQDKVCVHELFIGLEVVCAVAPWSPFDRAHRARARVVHLNFTLLRNDDGTPGSHFLIVLRCVGFVSQSLWFWICQSMQVAFEMHKKH